MPTKMIVRKNITIDTKLHAEAKKHAKSVHYTDFSGLVTKLIVDDLRKEAALKKTSKTTIRAVRTAAPLPVAKVG